VFKEKTMLAMVLARGGSKGLKDKNIRPFLGHPLIAWCIKAAQDSEVFDLIVAYSDSPKILETAREYGAETIEEPPALAADNVFITPAIQDLLVKVEKRWGRYDYVQLLQPTNPGVTSFQIRAAANQLISMRNGDMILGIHQYHDPTIVVKSLPWNHSLRGWYPQRFKGKNRQEVPPAYRINGYIYLAKWDVWASGMDYLKSDIYAYVCHPEDDIDINTLYDFELAEWKMGREGRKF